MNLIRQLIDGLANETQVRHLERKNDVLTEIIEGLGDIMREQEAALRRLREMVEDERQRPMYGVDHVTDDDRLISLTCIVEAMEGIE